MKSEVFNCDCLEYMKGLPNDYFDLAIANPPYGGANDPSIDGGGRFGERFDRYVNHAYGGRFARYEKSNVCRDGGTSVPNGKDIVEWDVAPKKEFFDELYRVSKNQIIWGANYFEMPPTRCFVVWRKTTISESFSMAMAEYAWTSFNGNAKVFECMPQDKRGGRFHPTAKPVELYGWLLKNFAKEGDKIFDPMMGSQASRIAAYLMGFDYWGCELDKVYFEKGDELFRKECMNETKVNGEIIKELTLFSGVDE